MYRTSLTAADEKLRAAAAALSEQERLTAIRAALLPDAEAAEREVAALHAKLLDEQRDVRRYERGIWAFLYDVLADRQARLTKEQREAAEAEARHQEAVALRDRLQEELASLAERIAARASAAAELKAARADKEALMIADGGPMAQELTTISEHLGKVDAETRAVDEALEVGGRTRMAMTLLVELLRSARNWGTADLFTDSFLVSWAKRNKLDEAKAIAGTAQAELTMFQRELGDVGLTLNAELTVLAERGRFLDTWFDNLFSDLAVQGRIENAQKTTDATLASVDARMVELRVRRAALVERGAALTGQRLRLLEG